MRVRKVSADGTITTVAGNGQQRTTGDGGPARQAGIARVTGVHALADGGFLIADPHAHRIRNVDAAGVISTVLGPSAFEDFAARDAYIGGFGFRRGPFSVAPVPDGLLMDNADAILYAPMATPIRPAIRIIGSLVRRGQITLSVDATQAGTATVRLRGPGRRVLSAAIGPIPAGLGTLRFDPGNRSGAHVIRIELRAGAGVATDDAALALGRRLAPSLATDALDSAVGDGDEGYYYGPYRCRRFSARRVDCEIAEQYLWPPRRVVCVSLATITLGRDGLLHRRNYRCPRDRRPVFRAHPIYRSPETVLPIDT
jgi:hypothetical protein